MRGRFCTQPFLVEGGTCRLNDFLLPLRWANRSPPHPTRLRRPTFPPRGRLCAVLPFPSAKPPPPARPAGGRAVTGVGSWAAGQAEKKRGPPQGPPKLEKVGPGRKNLFLPGVLSSGFLPKKAGLPRRSRRGPRGAAPQGQLRSYLPVGYAAPPPTKSGDTPKGIPTFYSTVSWMEPVAFSACTMI